MTVLIWNVIDGHDECVGIMHQYVMAVGITYIVESLLLIISTVLCTIIPPVQANNAFTFCIVTCGTMSIAWTGLGIGMLVNNECRGTDYYTYTIVNVITSGISVISIACFRASCK
jgi:hypothetical protein